MFGAAANQAGAANQTYVNTKVSGLQWDRQKRMMKNRHQWEVDDLRAAGLNPILSAGAAPSMGAPSAIPAPDMGGGGALMQNARKNKETRAMGIAQRALIGKQGKKVDADILNVKAQTALAGSAKMGTDLENMAKQFGIPRLALEASFFGSEEGQQNYRLHQWLKPFTAAIAGATGGAVAGAAAHRTWQSAAPGSGRPNANNPNFGKKRR